MLKSIRLRKLFDDDRSHNETLCHIGASKKAEKKCFGINEIEDKSILKDMLKKLEKC